MFSEVDFGQVGMVHKAQFHLSSLKRTKYFPCRKVTKWCLSFVFSVTTSQPDGIVGVHTKTSTMNE